MSLPRQPLASSQSLIQHYGMFVEFASVVPPSQGLALN